MERQGRKKFDLKRFFLTEFFTILLMTAGLLSLHGIPMGKIPKPEDVQAVEITDLSLGVLEKEIMEPDEIEMVFQLKDGSCIRFGGNETTAWKERKLI